MEFILKYIYKKLNLKKIIVELKRLEDSCNDSFKGCQKIHYLIGGHLTTINQMFTTHKKMMEKNENLKEALINEQNNLKIEINKTCNELKNYVKKDYDNLFLAIEECKEIQKNNNHKIKEL